MCYIRASGWGHSRRSVSIRPTHIIAVDASTGCRSQALDVTGVIPAKSCPDWSGVSIDLAAEWEGANAVRLTWDAVEGANHYRIYRGTGACGATNLAPLTDTTDGNTTYLDSVDAGNTVCYQVAAVFPSACSSWPVLLTKPW